MKTTIYALILLLVVVSGLVFANRAIKNEVPKRFTPKPISAADKLVAIKRWEATPNGIMYKKWAASPEGKKVRADVAKIKKYTNASANMEAVITSLSLPTGARVGFGMMVRIDGEDYILSFGPENPDKSFFSFNDDFQQLHNLKVNDKITIKSQYVSYAPKYSFAIVMGDYVEFNGKQIYKRAPRKGGC